MTQVVDRGYPRAGRLRPIPLLILALGALALTSCASSGQSADPGPTRDSTPRIESKIVLGADRDVCGSIAGPAGRTLSIARVLAGAVGLPDSEIERLATQVVDEGRAVTGVRVPDAPPPDQRLLRRIDSDLHHLQRHLSAGAIGAVGATNRRLVADLQSPRLGCLN